MLELLRKLEEALENASETQDDEIGEEKGFIMRVHHSRDNPRKQWGETYKFGLQGLSRLLRHFLPSHPLPAALHSSLLKLALHTLSFPTECAQAGVELLLLIVEVLGGGEAQSAPTGVVNGTLTHAKSPNMSRKSKSSSREMQTSSTFEASFDALKTAPSLISDQDVLAPLSDGVMALNESLDSVLLTHGMVDICVDILSRQKNETKYTTSAEKNCISALKKMASSSPYAFKALSKLASPAFQGGGTCVNMEAARSLGDVVGENESVTNKGSDVIDALSNLIEAEEEVPPAPTDDQPARYWRETSLEHLGEMLLPILRTGLSKLEEMRHAREKMASEYERLSETEELSSREEVAKERKIWDGVLSTLERFLRPKYCPPPPKMRYDNGAVVDTSLAVLGVVMGFAEEKEVCLGITACLARR